MATITLTIEGMTCNGCVRSVTKALQRLPSVTQATVDLAKGRAEVSYDPASLDPKTMVEAVTSAGYTATIAPGGG